MKKVLLSFALILAITQFVYSQQHQLKLDVDYAVFTQVDSVVQVEVYYHLLIEKEFGKKVPAFNGNLSIEFYNYQDTLKNRLYTYSIKNVFFEDSSYGRSITGIFTYYMKPGEYLTIVSIDDSAKLANPVTVNFKLPVPAQSATKFSISDIQLASNIIKSENTQSKFYKNTFEVSPNPNRLYNQNQPILFYYCELYNLQADIKSNQLRMLIDVYNANGERVYRRAKTIERKENNIVDVGTINLMKYATGTYTLTVALSDSIAQFTYLKQKKFFVFSQIIKDTSTAKQNENDFMASEFAVYSDDDIDDTFMQSKFIASQAELIKWGSLTDLDAKRHFMYEFWKKRDQSPETSENEFRKEFSSRVKYANEKFAAFNKKGWNSDRGRVYIINGEPSEIERFPSETEYKPYEIWHYHNLEGGVIFIFGDLNGYSDYVLIHSTLRGELRDDNWQRRLQNM